MSAITPERLVVTPREIFTKPRVSDRVFRGVLNVMSFSSLIILTLIGSFLMLRGFQVFKGEGLSFITGFEWTSAVNDGVETSTFGLGSMLIGTLLISATALVVGVPLSVLTALYLNFYAPLFIRKFLTTVLDLMAAFPSILYGLWGYFILMPMAEYWAKLLNRYLGWIPIFSVPQPAFTRSPFVAGLVLAIMIIPIVTSVSREVFSQTPLDRIQAAYALGATKWAMIKTVVLPFGSSGVVGGAMLGLGRAMGETVAVYMVLNIAFSANLKVLYGVGGNVASMIVSRWGESTLLESKALLAAGFVLFVMTLAVNFLANFIVKRAVKSGK
ncbi:MAG: phosphate ABC transporter permease subunit PstC [Acidobacteria bacterium]|nr:phosphate ABC transporter permease subunit PstC [Acidobacteriota bacterium]